MANINNEFMAKVFAELHHRHFKEYLEETESADRDALIMQNQLGEHVRILCLKANLTLGDFVRYRVNNDEHSVVKPGLDLSGEARIQEIALHFPFMSSELRRHNKVLVSLDFDQLEVLYQRMHDLALFIGDCQDRKSRRYLELNAHKELISLRIAHDIANERVGSDELYGVQSHLYTGVVAEFALENMKLLFEFYGLNIAGKVSKWAEDYAESVEYFKILNICSQQMSLPQETSNQRA